MKAIILAAGLGTRLGELGKEIPKCLLEINGKTLLENQIEILKKANIKEIIVVVGKEGSCWTKEAYRKIKLLCNNVKINEHNISKKRAYSLLKGLESLEKGPAIVIDGDIFIKKIVIEMMLENKNANIALVKESQKTKELTKSGSSGKIRTDKEGNIQNFVDREIAGKSYVYGGVMKVGKEMFFDIKSIINKMQDASFADIINTLCKKHKIKIMTARKKWANINTQEDLESAKSIEGSKEIGVIWDMDGVIFDSASFQLKAYRESFSKFGVSIDDKDYLENEGRKDAFQRICSKYKISVNLNEWLEEKRRIYWGLMEKGIDTLPGVKELICSLEEKGYKQAIASSTSKSNLLFILNKLNIRKYFDVLVASEDVINGKPNPEVFIKASQELGLKSNNCAVIEDSAYGIDAAKKADMKCIAVTLVKRHTKNLNKADLIVNSLAEIDIPVIINLINRNLRDKGRG